MIETSIFRGEFPDSDYVLQVITDKGVWNRKILRRN